MKFPAKIEYACRAIIELALRYQGDAPVQIGTVSKAQDIPKNFLMQLMIRLKNAGLVSSARGLAGGYYLAKEPSRITLADVIRAVDDNIIEIPPAKEKGKAPESSRLVMEIWGGINKEMLEKLEAVTVDQLAGQLRREEIVYHI